MLPLVVALAQRADLSFYIHELHSGVLSTLEFLANSQTRSGSQIPGSLTVLLASRQLTQTRTHS